MATKKPEGKKAPASGGALFFVFSAGGILACFSVYGIAQEGVWSYKAEDGGKFKETSVFLLCEHGFAAFIALLLMYFDPPKMTWSPSTLLSFFPLSVFQLSAKYASNESLKHVDFVVQALAKSSKTIPAMFGAFFTGKKFTIIQWTCAFFITGGTAGFTVFGKSGGGGGSSGFGIGLLVGSLLCDGIISWKQTSMRESVSQAPSAIENMFLLNFGASLCVLPYSYYIGELETAIAFLMGNPELIKKLLLFACMSSAGQVFIFITITFYGPEVTAKVTTIRKMLTVLFSIIVYGKQVNETQWGCVALVFGAVIAELLEKALSKPKVSVEKKTK